jgi:hypothetical protein
MFFPTTRYRVPMEFVLLFYASVALDRAMLRVWAVNARTSDRGAKEVRRVVGR